VPEPCRLATLDVSFISLRKILPALAPVLAEGADVVALVKPQFEVGRSQVGRGGLVRDPALQLAALLRVAEAAGGLGYAVVGACPSPIEGHSGNREFFLHLRRGAETPRAPAELAAVLRKAVSG
jgi:23S rRNA (cytidine1920-2'-O)/16S rRNA (cytidine1409-2'-O)-methyltransferase